MIVVSDTTPLRHLIAIGEAELLPKLYGTVTEKGFITFAAFDPPCSPAFPRRESAETFIIHRIRALSFLNHFNHFRVSGPRSSVPACYTRISRRQCIIPSLPSSPSPSRSLARPNSGIPLNLSRLLSETARETHLAQKPFKMRLPTSTHRRNPLKKRTLQRPI
jgi:hypothetical protein